jgi:hypothetical protein
MHARAAVLYEVHKPVVVDLMLQGEVKRSVVVYQ